MSKSWTFLGLTLLIGMGVVQAVPAQGGNPSPRELLHRCWTAQKALERMSYHESWQSRRAISFTEEYGYSAELTVKRDSTRMVMSSYILFPDEMRKPSSQKVKLVVDGKRKIEGTAPYFPPKGAKGEGWSYSEAPERVANTLAVLAGSLNGYFPGLPEPVAKLLEEKGENLYGSEEALNGSACKLIVGRVPDFGEFKLWLSERHSFMPLKVVSRLGPTDLNLATGSRYSELSLPYDTELKERVWFQFLMYVLDNVEYTELGGTSVPICGRQTKTIEFSKGRKLVTLEEYKRDQIQLNPVISADELKVEIRDGSRVLNEDDPSSGVRYEWRGGKVVPAFKDFSGTAEGVWGARSVWVVVLWVLIGLVLLVVTARLILRHKTARK